MGDAVVKLLARRKRLVHATPGSRHDFGAIRLVGHVRLQGLQVGVSVPKSSGPRDFILGILLL